MVLKNFGDWSMKKEAKIMSFKNKKAQITMFIIIAIMILFASAAVLFTREKIAERGIVEFEKVAKVPLELTPVKTFIENCIEKEAIPAIYFMAIQGGHIYPPVNSFVTEQYVVGYGYYLGQNTLPSIEEMELQLSAYVDLNLYNCINDFEEFRKQGLNIGAEAVNTTTKITEERVAIKVNYPVTLYTDGSEAEASEFISIIPIRLGKLRNDAEKIVLKEIENPDSIELNFISRFDSEVNSLPYDSSTTLYTLYDLKSSLSNVPFIFMFANKFDENSAPELGFIADQILFNREEFYIKIDATDLDNDALTFSDNTDLFDINPATGEIRFTPATAGKFTVEIAVADNKGSQDKKEVLFIVE